MSSARRAKVFKEQDSDTEKDCHDIRGGEKGYSHVDSSKQETGDILYMRQIRLVLRFGLGTSLSSTYSYGKN